MALFVLLVAALLLFVVFAQLLRPSAAPVRIRSREIARRPRRRL